MKTFSLQVGFVMINTAIRFMLNPKDPFTSNELNVREKWDQLPRAMAKQSDEFITYGPSPLRFLESLGDIVRFNRF